MSKLIAHLLVGIAAAAALMILNATVFPESLHESEAFDRFISVCYVACIIVPCVIYYLKTPRGTDNRGQR